MSSHGWASGLLSWTVFAPLEELKRWRNNKGCLLDISFRRPRSMAVILFNKWLLAYSGFPFPLALTMCGYPNATRAAASQTRLLRCPPSIVHCWKAAG